MINYDTIIDSSHAIIPPIHGSKFEGYIFHAETADEIQDIVEKIWGMHPKATHVCYAYCVGLQIQQDLMSQVVIHSERDYTQDDGEPSGTAGRPILQVLQGANLRNVGCAVVRYYGGTNLGVGGLVKAYTQTAQAVLEQAAIVQTPITRELTIIVDMSDFHEVMQWREHQGYEFVQRVVGDSMEVVLLIPWDDYDDFQGQCQLKGWKMVG